MSTTQKQCCGLLHYLTSEAHSDPSSCIEIINFQFIEKICRAIRWSTALLLKMSRTERLGARGSCFGDVVEYACATLHNLMVGLNDPVQRSARFIEEEDDPSKRKTRQNLQKETIGTLRMFSNDLLEARGCVEGCSFETTALLAVGNLLTIIRSD